MNRHDDLPLFRWTPPEVEVIPFPTSKRVGLIRRVAEFIQFSRTEQEGKAYWRRTIDGMIRQMERAGVPDERIEKEVDTFHDCVQAQMHRIARRPRQPGGDAA